MTKTIFAAAAIAVALAVVVATVSFISQTAMASNRVCPPRGSLISPEGRAGTRSQIIQGSHQALGGEGTADVIHTTAACNSHGQGK
jgi:hypothetical protein